MSTERRPVILYIGFAQSDEWRHWATTYAVHTDRFRAAAGNIPVITIPYDIASDSLISSINPSAVVLSGFARSFEDYAPETLRPVVDWLARVSSDLPVLAICGSHQLLGFVYNGQYSESQRLRDQPIRLLRTGEPVVNPEFHPEYFMEKGFYSLELSAAGTCDPLLANLETEPVFCESHYCEIKSLPTGFELLASTPECSIQAMRKCGSLLYGLQFHPEDFTERFFAGRRLLENFFRL